MVFLGRHRRCPTPGLSSALPLPTAPPSRARSATPEPCPWVTKPAPPPKPNLSTTPLGPMVTVSSLPIPAFLVVDLGATLPSSTILRFPPSFIC
ncbi:hypothetical protein GUJ93_ZPchr0011g27910 [Zizania palustris]|uniref:Uncharacterized protein n=1 Tax=Zizania palustris TaxID=103762 RepID=A0A8J5WJI4_ZIZPA|nr:hypothetical protein GUJ93_ZPchr0011g27910 [Zizania palustris]